MNASNPDHSRGKKGRLGRPNRTDDKESITDNNHNKSKSQIDHAHTQQTNVDISPRNTRC